MAGFNGQEGSLITDAAFKSYQASHPEANLTLPSAQFVRDTVSDYCDRLTPLSSELCAQYYTDIYMLDNITDDRERGIVLSYLQGIML